MQRQLRTILCRRRGGSRPTRSVVVCGMPRSGTSYVSGLLESSGRVSLPREWFDPWKEPGGITDYRAFVGRVVADCPRDVFGVKFVGDQMWAFLARLRAVAEVDEPSDHDLLRTVFPDPRFVWMRRRDTIAEAVSLWRAGKVDEWVLAPDDTPTAVTPPAFDFDEIDSRVEEIVRGEERWERWFEAQAIEPVRLVYEELDASPVETTLRVLALLDVEIPEDVPIVARTVRQSDALNEKWMARYRSMAAARAER